MSTTESKGKGNAKVLRDYFGYKQGEGLQEFANELKQLSDDEKDVLAEGIRNGSLNY